jgi:oligopeptide transport system substrate-binding protein
MLVFADVATGIVPTGVYDSNSAKKLFRDSANGDYKYLTKNLDEALKLLESVDIDPEDCSFSLTVAAYDEAHILIAEAIVEAWCELGFDVDIKLRGTIANNDYYKYTESVPSDICDDTYAEDLRSGKFEVILLDLVAISVDPFSVLAPFAKGFSGQGMDMSTANNYKLTPHVTGYDSEEYNALMEEIFAEKTIENRTAKLHEAENLLMEDMPVAPIVFNKTAILVNDGLKAKVKTAATNYYTANTLQRIQVKDFDEYVIVCADFIESKFDEYKENPLSYFGNDTYSVMSFEEFKEESSNYGYFLRKKSAAN